jgi:hypothetical protein
MCLRKELFSNLDQIERIILCISRHFSWDNDRTSTCCDNAMLYVKGTAIRSNSGQQWLKPSALQHADDDPLSPKMSASLVPVLLRASSKQLPSHMIDFCNMTAPDPLRHLLSQ